MNTGTRAKDDDDGTVYDGVSGRHAAVQKRTRRRRRQSRNLFFSPNGCRAHRTCRRLPPVAAAHSWCSARGRRVYHLRRPCGTRAVRDGRTECERSTWCFCVQRVCARRRAIEGSVREGGRRNLNFPCMGLHQSKKLRGKRKIKKLSSSMDTRKKSQSNTE